MRTRWRRPFALVWLVALLGCDKPLPGRPVVEKEAPGCRVDGRIVSTAWKDLGGGIERAIVSVWTLPKVERIDEVYADGERFETRLPPGKFRLVCSANGTRGATFQVQSREVSIAEKQDRLEIGQIDLPISKTTGLYGKSAPDLAGIIDWKDTPPLAIQDLQGKVIVLDFFAYYCSICHAHKPDLAKLREKYERQGLVVLAVHDASLKTMDEVNAKMKPVLNNVFDGTPPKLPIALDGTGEQSVFEAYGIYAVPAVVLIDQRGRIVRRYHHAGVPQLEADVARLLNERSQAGR
jgi:thiol-disulfide isomerase/thioredoxin